VVGIVGVMLALALLGSGLLYLGRRRDA
jgi:hypothetical protein